MVRLAADRLDATLTAVADSTQALGRTYARLAAKGNQEHPDALNVQQWQALALRQGNTIGFQSWPGDRNTSPAFQSPYASYYSYGDREPNVALARQLNLFKVLVPTFRTAYESFPFSWVYMTTADGAMMIYPYLPIGEAVNNQVPTREIYYTSANFKQRQTGWTQPYLDLVGAGMMVTVSYPVYQGDVLLGVMSRDITLQQLSESVLSHLGSVPDSSALIVTNQGLAIGANNPMLSAEIIQVDTQSGSDVLYFRTAEGLAAIPDTDAVASSSALINGLVEQVVYQARQGKNQVRLGHEGQCVLSAPVNQTGWLVILILPQDA